MCVNLHQFLKKKLILWIIVNANNTNFAQSLENAFLHKGSSLLHKDIELPVSHLVCETVSSFIKSVCIWDA